MSLSRGNMEKSHLPHSKIKPYGGMKLSIRPIDYQITINKTSDFTKDANFVRTKPNIEQVQFSQELQRQKVHEEKKVNSTTETEYGKIDGKNKKNKQFSKMIGRTKNGRAEYRKEGSYAT